MAIYVPELERPIKECLLCGRSHGTLRLFVLEDPWERWDIDVADSAKGKMAGKIYDARTKKWKVPTFYFNGVNPPEHRNSFYVHYNCGAMDERLAAMMEGVGVRETPWTLQCKPTYAYKAVAAFKRGAKVFIKEKLGIKALRKFDYLLKPHPKFFCNIRTHTTRAGCEWHFLPDYCWWIQQILDKLRVEMDEMVFQVASVVNPPESYRMRKQVKKLRKASMKPRRESIDPTLLWKLDARAIQAVYDFLFLEKGWDWTVNVEKVRPDGTIFRNNIIGKIASGYITKLPELKWTESDLRKIVRDSMGFLPSGKIKHVRVKYTFSEIKVKTSHSSA